MTLDEVVERVKEIERLADTRRDREATTCERELYVDVLSAIAYGEAADPSALAKAAGQAHYVLFTRADQ